MTCSWGVHAESKTSSCTNLSASTRAPAPSRGVRIDAGPARASDAPQGRAGGDERHHRPASVVGRYDDALARPDLRFAVRGLYAKPANRRVPRLGSRMAMFRGCIAGIRDTLHVLDRILFTRLHRQWAHFGYTYATRRPPPGLADGEQPDSAQGLDDGATRSLRRLRSYLPSGSRQRESTDILIQPIL
jgi:hypothetical protein